MILTKQHIEKAFEWSDPKEVETKRGRRLLRKAKASLGSRSFWAQNRNECSAAGVSFSEWPKGSGNWEFSWWQELPRELLEERHNNAITSRATSADVEIPKPEGLEYMPFQRAGIAWMRGKDGVLLADEMGLGKTIQIIGAINERPEARKILIVAPSFLLINWMRELRKWLVRPMDIGIVDGKTFPTAEIVLIGYPMLKKWEGRLSTVHWDIIAADEVHNVKNPSAQRSRVLLGYKPKRTEPAEEARAPIQARMRIAATGTPICNFPRELWPIIHWVRPDIWNNWWKFMTKYCGMTRDDYGSVYQDNARSLAELQQFLRETTMVRRLKKDVLKELPPKIRTVIALPPPAGVLESEAKAFGEMDDERIEACRAKLELAKAGDDASAYEAAIKELESIEGVRFEEIARVRHETALAKVAQSLEVICGDLESGVEKCLVFAHHLDVMTELCAGFSEYGCLRLDGSMSTPQRQSVVDRFQNDPSIRVMVLGIIPGGVGWTLTAANYVYHHEIDWRPGIVSQAEDRAHRIGQMDTVFVKHIVLEGTIDAKMAQTIVRKQDAIEKALDRKADENGSAPGWRDAVKEQAWSAAEAMEPVNPTNSVSPRRNEIEAIAAKITNDGIDRVHDALKRLAEACDGARKIDGAGFSKIDVRIGKELAEIPFLSQKQAALGYMIARKYSRQIGEIVL